MKSFKSSEEITQPDKINKVFQDTNKRIDTEVANSIGQFKTEEKTVTVETSGIEGMVVESNDTNKRIVVNLGGKLYYTDLTEIT